MKLTLEQIKDLRLKGIITRAVSSESLVGKTVEELRLGGYITRNIELKFEGVEEVEETAKVEEKPVVEVKVKETAKAKEEPKSEPNPTTEPEIEIVVEEKPEEVVEE